MDIMRCRHLLGAVVATLAVAALPATAPAASKPKKPYADVLGAIEASPDGTTATLRVRYRCNAGDHLWVSVKESATGKKDWALRREGSSELAATWLQSHRNTWTCDGTKRTETFNVDAVEPGSKGALVHGRAYVQFCLTQGEGEIVIYETGFSWVHRGSATT
jgi:hypothetical protein